MPAIRGGKPRRRDQTASQGGKGHRRDAKHQHEPAVTERQLLDTIGYLYDVATDVRAWPQALEQLTRLVGAEKAHLLHVDFEHRKLAFSARYNVHLTADQKQKFVRYLPTDPRVSVSSKRALLSCHTAKRVRFSAGS